MAGGLIALLDDVAAIAKAAAASIDDVAGAAGRAGVKVAGVVVDDTAVTPRYVGGIAPARELPMIWRIALGSLRNKLLLLLPAALLLSAVLPQAITPILMLGGAYLCYEAAEKVVEALHGGDAAAADTAPGDARALEDAQVSGAVRTDLILSAEIMAIALGEVSDQAFLTRAIALALVGIGITAGVYGVVAMIVKIDDVGLFLSRRPSPAARATGRALVAGMPRLLAALSVIGTAAMLWVGGQIVVHGLAVFHLTPLPGWVHGAAEAARGIAGGFGAWLASAALSGVMGIVIGGVLVGAHHLVRHARGAPAHG